MGYFAGTAIVAALFGFIFGWYQAYPAQHSRDRALLRLRLSEARARALDARVSLFRSNFGDAQTHTAEAIRLLEAFATAGRRDLPPTEQAKVDQALQALRDASGLTPTAPTTASVSPDTPRPESQADAKAEQAANLLGEVYRATPEP